MNILMPVKVYNFNLQGNGLMAKTYNLSLKDAAENTKAVTYMFRYHEILVVKIYMTDQNMIPSRTDGKVRCPSILITWNENSEENHEVKYQSHYSASVKF